MQLLHDQDAFAFLCVTLGDCRTAWNMIFGLYDDVQELPVDIYKLDTTLTLYL